MRILGVAELTVIAEPRFMDTWFTWRDMSAQPVINPASEIFNGALNEVGRTYPVFNGMRTWTGLANAASDQMANAINGPVIERMGPQVRMSAPGRNLASALLQVPANGPWTALVDVRAVHAFGTGTTRSCEAIRGVLSSLPMAGSITVRVLANARFTASTLEHERRHAQDIRRICESVFAIWNYAISDLSGRWFESESAMDESLFRAANLTGYQGMRRRRLAQEIVLRIGIGANDLHFVVDRNNQFMIVNPRWIPTDRTLQFSLEEAGGVATRNRRLSRRLV